MHSVRFVTTPTVSLHFANRANWIGDEIVAPAVKILKDNFDMILAELKTTLPDYNKDLADDSSTVCVVLFVLNGVMVCLFPKRLTR